jgi:anthranilate synthase component II
MKKIILIDNYDSFTYNLHHYLEDIAHCSIPVMRNDAIDWDLLSQAKYIVLSPGPGLPDEAGSLKEIIYRYAPSHQILGICLGMQAMAECFHGNLLNLQSVVHGISNSLVRMSPDEKLFQGIPEMTEVGRYHSWVVNPDSVKDQFYLTSFNQEGLLMSIRHKLFPSVGLQFHPESILTPLGKKMLENFIN